MKKLIIVFLFFLSFYTYSQDANNILKKSEEKIDCDSLLMEDVWEEEHHIKMKYNRMIIFPSYMWHSAIIKKGLYKDKPRVSLSGFVPPSNLGVE